MSDRFITRVLRTEFAPPRYLSLPAAGIDISTSGIKAAVLAERVHGLELVKFAEELLPAGAVVGGEIAEPGAVTAAIQTIVKKNHIKFANIALSESRSYLFEAALDGNHEHASSKELRTLMEPHLDEYVPLPPADVAFDVARIATTESSTTVVGVGYARRVIDESLATLDDVGITTRAIESETFSIARALMPRDSKETVLIIDIGKTTTKLMVVTGQTPRFATTLDIGGDSLTQAVMKHFGVSEEEAKKVKAEKGLVSENGKDEYMSSMLLTVSAIREEITRRLEYWQGRAKEGTAHEPVTRIILTGGNATVRGLPEYLETAIKLPVALGDVFTNLASRDHWLPPLDYMESLAYATAIGLALRDFHTT
jgi:type IV pilus assembly protein PilM